jgi:hypothetical protein
MGMPLGIIIGIVFQNLPMGVTLGLILELVFARRRRRRRT